jgi:hypothetical protein
MIEEEKRRDQFLRRVSKIAWIVTFAIVLLFTVMVGMQVSQMVQLVGGGQLAHMAVIGAAMPLFIVLGLLSVLIATLSTIGIFLRFRTASLAEIQLRLAALEDILTRGESGA